MELGNATIRFYLHHFTIILLRLQAPQKIVVKPRQIDPDGGQNGLSTAHAQQDKVAVEEVTVGLGAKVTEEEVRAAAALKDKNLSHSIHVNRDGDDEPSW